MDGSGDSDGASKKNGSTGKEKTISLEEAKRRGRQLRSAHKEGGLMGMYGGLSMEFFTNQSHGVGLVYDERMLNHYCSWDPEHPEKPDRLRLSYERCKEYGLINRCISVPARMATEDEVLLCHSQEWLEKLRLSSEMSETQLMELSSKYDGVYFNQSTYYCSMLALGSTLELVNHVITQKVRHGMALVRPPGHHAMSNEACGYCFINNIAVAAKHALEEHGLERILVIDWDVHHGQGTQYTFYDDPRVVYMSIHRYEYGKFWPNLHQSEYDQIGEGAGQGYNVNVPLNQNGMTNGDYLAIFTQLILPIAYEYNPQLVLVSAGYDAAIGCPEGENNVTPAMFAHFVNLLKPLANGKLALILEGGYCIKSLAESVALSLRALLEDPCPKLGPLDPASDSMVCSILRVQQQLRPYWKSLAYQEVSEADPEIFQRHVMKEEVEFSTLENKPEKFDIIGDYILHPKEREEELDKAISSLIDQTDLTCAIKRNVKFSTDETRPAKFPLHGIYPVQTDSVKQVLSKAIDNLITSTDLTVCPHRACLAYDEKMRGHRCTSMGSHPERPDRIRAIFDKHVECGLAERSLLLNSRQATDEEILLVHEMDHLKTVKSYQDVPVDELQDMEQRLNSVYLSQKAYESASIAVGCSLEVVDTVCTCKARGGVAIVRPPGHHAESHESCGFCYFNTAAIAAKYAQKTHGVKKVLILDWDVHHGNGTQHMFWSDPSVLYISLHRYDYGFFFPGGNGGNFDMVGEGLGTGYNINIPWNTKCGDAEYLAAFIQIVLPVAYEFAPDLVLVSAGFDAARGDPLGGFKVTPEGYALMTKLLMGLAGGRVILMLEGGYNLHSISESMAMCTSMLLGDVCPSIPSLVPTEGGVETISTVLDTHCMYWKSLQFRVPLPLVDEHKEQLLKEQNSVSSLDEVTAGINRLSVSSLPRAAQVYSTEESSPESSPEVNRRPQETEVSSGQEVSALDVVSEGVVGEGAPTVVSQSQIDSSPPAVGSCQLEELEGATGGSPNKITVFTLSELLGDGTDGQETQEMFTVVPLPWCPHLEEGVTSLPERGLHVGDPCIECGHIGENWVCLTCHQVHCGRYVNEHMLMHGLETEHRVVLSYADLSCWCYGCDSYVHNEILLPAKRAAHLDKFGEEPAGL